MVEQVNKLRRPTADHLKAIDRMAMLEARERLDVKTYPSGSITSGSWTDFYE